MAGVCHVLRSDVPDDAVRDTTNFSASKLKKVFELAKAWMRARGYATTLLSMQGCAGLSRSRASRQSACRSEGVWTLPTALGGSACLGAACSRSPLFFTACETIRRLATPLPAVFVSCVHINVILGSASRSAP